MAPNALAAVIDWPTMPSVIHTVGTAWVAGSPACTNREYTIVMMIIPTSRLSPNIA